MKDSASAYDVCAQEFLRVRDRSTIGVDVLNSWAKSLEPGTDLIEVGCGGGWPVTKTLAALDLNLWAVDSSPTMLATFGSRFPDIPTECASALDATYFGRLYGAAIAIGLVFLLSAEGQERFIRRISQVLRPTARFLFTAPIELGTWVDVTTGIECRSLGLDSYAKILGEAGFVIRATYIDEGKNNYYEVVRE